MPAVSSFLEMNAFISEQKRALFLDVLSAAHPAHGSAPKEVPPVCPTSGRNGAFSPRDNLQTGLRAGGIIHFQEELPTAGNIHDTPHRPPNGESSIGRNGRQHQTHHSYSKQTHAIKSWRRNFSIELNHANAVFVLTSSRGSFLSTGNLLGRHIF
jgi:hypothetical protein